MIRQYELVDLVRAYDPDVDEDLLNRAYVYAMKAHGAQTRASGDPYFLHPLEVAGLLTEMKLDAATIATALLHDTIEDTETTFEDLQRLFGQEIAHLVDGVTKLTRIEMHSDQAKQAENFRKLVLAMSEDIRVLLVKLADRVHNMQTLHFISKPEKRKRIARETLDIYAPLAERIGCAKFKEILEELAFKELSPEAHESIVARLTFLRSEDNNGMVDKIISELKKLVVDNGIEAMVTGREKTPYSIWRKMQRQNVAFEQLSDIMAFRVVVDSIADCYQVLGFIHANYPLVPGRFKDYISTPKPNGYRSLHTTVIGPQRQRIEVQIRTADMHENAILGVAAHWSYKQGQSTDGRQYRWVRDFLDILDNAQRPEEFLEHTKLELFQDQVFCFTPKGDVVALPRGATSVDFAYAVHSDVGDRCVGGKINGRLMPLNTVLQNGDQVEIATSKNQTPSPTWERFVVTGKARARIRRFIRKQQRQEYASLGKAMLQKIYRQEGYEFAEKGLLGVLKNFRYDDVEDLYAAVGAGHLTSREVFTAVFPGHRQPSAEPVADVTEPQNIVPINKARTQKRKGKDAPLPIKGLIPGLAVHYARCCHPLPGDRIVGIVTTGKGVSIHTIDCETLESFAETPERWLDVAWEADNETTEEHTARISVIIANEPGSLGTLSTVIGKNGGNIMNLKVSNRTTDFWEMLIDIQVKDVRHLTNIIAALRATPVINSVDRAQQSR